MKAFKYQVRVDNDLVHPWSGRIITEIFVPQKNLFFNNEYGIFIAEKGTYQDRLNTIKPPMPVTDIELENNVIKKLYTVAKDKEKVEEFIDKIFKK